MIILNKPKDMTSNDCLSIIKKNLHPKKIGHTGTLDKNATGVLICLLGSATKSQDYLMKSCTKKYKAELLFGIVTDTEDITGNVTNVDDEKINKYCESDINKTIRSFIGNYSQIPPMYSAKKIGGKKLLNLARNGIVVERKAENLEIYNIDIIDYKDYNYNQYKLKCVNIIVECSKGTYIRTLCKDIGEKLGVPSCMGDLCRLSSGDFNIEDSINLDELKEKSIREDYSFIKPCYYTGDKNAITFGKFETLHLGHLKIINDVVDYAKSHSIKSTVMIVGCNVDNDILTDAQRISKLKLLGVDNIIYYPLNNINKNIEAIDFVEKILYKQLNASYIVVGSDCSFGYKGNGNKELLMNICNKHNIKCKIIEKLKIENTNIDISSTYIKSQFENGNIEEVKKLLGK